jgi:hypoxia up-regulated 1
MSSTPPLQTSTSTQHRAQSSADVIQATRFPETHYPYVKPLLGASHESHLPPFDVYPSRPQVSSEGVVTFPHPSAPSHISPSPSSESEAWTPTALLAHQISYFRGLAESLAGNKEPVNQVVVTVPAWWNTHQRKAYRDALELQGLSCTAMIGEGTAVALNYAMTRDFPPFNVNTSEGQKEYHMIYDSGAMSTTATIVAFYQTSYLPTPKSKTPINTTHIEIVSTAWSPLGGVLLDETIQKMLVEDFIKKSGRAEIKQDKKAMAKLAREATRVKHILSANQESNVNVSHTLWFC